MRYSLVAVVCLIFAGIISFLFLLSGAELPVSAPAARLPPPTAHPRYPNPTKDPDVQGPFKPKPADQSDADCRDKMHKLGVVSTGPCVDVSEIVQNLASGTYVFNKPDSAYVDTPFHIILVLKTSPTQDVAPLLSGMPGQVAQREGKFAQSLEATLHGDDLMIDPSGAQSRTATTVEPVTWEWTITPKTGGQKTLILEVVANIQAGADRHKVQIQTRREPIQVSVSGFQQIKAYIADANGFLLAAG